MNTTVKIQRTRHPQATEISSFEMNYPGTCRLFFEEVYEDVFGTNIYFGTNRSEIFIYYTDAKGEEQQEQTPIIEVSGWSLPGGDAYAGFQMYSSENYLKQWYDERDKSS